MLKPWLFDRLREKFGRVLVSNENGEPEEDGRGGEQYRVCCPFCGDKSFRLYISHTWADNQGLAKCFNETDCLSSQPRRDQLYGMVFEGRGNAKTYSSRHENPSHQIKEPNRELEEISPPGDITPLTSLPNDHPAILFLTDPVRGFDPVELSDRFGVGFCTKAEDRYRSFCENRLYIPIIFGGKLIGWQARHIPMPTDEVTSVSRKEIRAPKYFTMPGLHKSRLLYNYDQAMAHDNVVLVEGVSDVWKAGGSAVALLGSSLSSQQRVLLGAGWGRRGKLVILLDADVPQTKKEGMLNSLRLSFGDRASILNPLDGAKDPGECNSKTLRESIQAKFQSSM